MIYFLIALAVTLLSFIMHTWEHYLDHNGRKSGLPKCTIDVAVTAGYISWIYMIFSDPFQMPLPYALPIGLALGMLGLITAGLGAREKKGFTEVDKLVTTGIFSRLRHPIYVGMALLYIGFPLAAGSIFTMACTILWLPFILAWRHWEQLELTRRFGKKYRDYMKSTLF